MVTPEIYGVPSAARSPIGCQNKPEARIKCQRRLLPRMMGGFLLTWKDIIVLNSEVCPRWKGNKLLHGYAPERKRTRSRDAQKDHVQSDKRVGGP